MSSIYFLFAFLSFLNQNPVFSVFMISFQTKCIFRTFHAISYSYHPISGASFVKFSIVWSGSSMDNALEPPTQSAASKWVYWGRETHICVGKLTIIGSDNGLSPDRRQAIIWTNDEILLIGPLGTNFSEILIAILTLSFKKMRLKVSSVKRRPFCLGLNVLISDIHTVAWYRCTTPVLFCGHRRSPPLLERKRTTVATLNKKGLAYR